MGVVIPLEEKIQESGIDGLLALVTADMDRVNQTILSRAASDVSMIPEVANHLISSGGKRLRPMLTLAAAGLCGYTGAGHIKLAASVEFMHTATLLHDDVVDESDMRRGKLAARMLWGNEASVLVGDFLLGQAFKMMVEVGSLPCLDVLSSAAAVIAEGEVMQLSAAKDTETSEDDYLAVIRAKTAALFGAASEVGALLGQRPKPEIAACRGYGLNLGIAFQLIDDALDYGGTSAKLGKNVGDDFREGKITLPVVLSFRRGSQKQREFWRRTLEQGAIAEGDLETAITTLRLAPRARGYDRARPPLRGHGARCLGAVSRLAMEIRLKRGRRFLRQPRLLSVPSRTGGGFGFSDPLHQSRLSMCPILARSSPVFRNLFSSLRDNNSCENYCERAADSAIPAGERETRMGYSRIGWAMGVVAPWCLGMALAVSISADAGQEASFGASWAPVALRAPAPPAVLVPIEPSAQPFELSIDFGGISGEPGQDLAGGKSVDRQRRGISPPAR